MNLYPNRRPLLVLPHADPLSRRARSALFLIVSAYVERLCATLRPFNSSATRQIIPIPAPYLNLCTRSAHSKYIAFPEGGFLQVAVSEAPGQGSCDCRLFRGGRFRYSTKTYRYYQTA